MFYNIIVIHVQVYLPLFCNIGFFKMDYIHLDITSEPTKVSYMPATQKTVPE